MIFFLILLSYLFLVINFGAPAPISNTSDFVLFLEHTGVLIICYVIIKRHFKDKTLCSKYFKFFLIGYCLSLLYLYSEWGQQLYKTFSIGWDAFDPVKYYSMAAVSIQQTPLDFSMFPVAYVYYVLMKVFGLNPLVPLFFNEICFVYAVCLISLHINEKTPNQLRYYAWLMLIPELLVFNVTSSKDILCCLCATIVFVKSSDLLKKKISVENILVLTFFFIVFVLARTSLAMASICGVMLTLLFTKKLSKKTFFLIAVVLAMGLGASFLTSGSEYVSTDIVAEKVGTEMSGDVSNAAQLNDQSSSGFANYLIPHNTIEYVVFGFVRSICYIVIDPRFINNPIDVLLPFSGLNMRLFVDYTTLTMFIFCFFFIIWLFRRFRSENSCVKDVFIVTALYWYSVGTFNPMMIHVRYRIVYDILFFSLAIRSYLTRKKIGEMHSNKLKRYDSKEYNCNK